MEQLKARGRVRDPGKMNGTEARYADLLEARKRAGEIAWFQYECLSLKLAQPRCAYHPDFLVMLSDGTLEVHEVKGGFIREDGWLKLKIAASHFPFVFRKCVWKDGEWTITLVGAQAMEARQGRDAKRLDAAGTTARSRRDAPASLPVRTSRVPGAHRRKYDGGPIPDGMCVENGYLVDVGPVLAQILGKRSA